MRYEPNYSLMHSLDLCEAEITAIEIVGQHLFDILENPLVSLKADDVAPLVGALETTLQHLWGFHYNPTLFKYQYAMKGCTCDPLKSVGNLAWTDGLCPFHTCRIL